MENRDDPVRVVVVDDEELVRMALRLVIDGEPDLTVVAEAADGNAALRVVDEQRPDVVLMDVRMPGRDGLDTARELLARPAPPRVLMLTTFDSSNLVLGALRVGALGFVLKDTPPSRILDAVRTVADGNPVLSPAATARVIAAATGPDSAHARGRHREAARRRLSVLTERERETARAIADGLGNPQIAERLRITVATVKAHTGSLFAKLAVENRVQIALLVRDAED
ncbi:response regulator transcription factor [Streptomyces sp. NPDC053741]|uniref:response regulator n=1 Tax=Streptomyces TaxID=1883 RepID=UPI000BC4B834|nr:MULTISPECIES: response regulator transcription factor [unclassified Streptomyces]RAS32220.1 LuxR family two component transcriptional regulator [Streptomyces avidinii]TPM79747.1 response regulator transcription factor [Mesorhizobium sp. B2-3-3]SNX75978.1 two component transcriptional regulator, LuxR family [Streptomyces microflavus]MDX2619929.1 response regulator transcription factor [Streptomyces sp. WI03-5b]MEE1781192.1 response regulator transcription factor [Streptomyces sp. JV181]